MAGESAKVFCASLLQEAVNDVSIGEHAGQLHGASLSVDSRTIKPGQVFVALRGQQVDGHDYIGQALDRGARGVVIARGRRDALARVDGAQLTTTCIIEADDPYTLVVESARTWRKQLTMPIVAVTGSAGKTTTKALLGRMCTFAGTRCFVSHDNQNTLLGVSLNLLRVGHDAEVAVFEVGVSERDEMGRVADLLRPTLGIITNIGHQHMDGLGSLHDVAFEKRQLFRYFEGDNIGIVNGDQELLSHAGYAHPTIRFGVRTTNQIQARKISSIGAQVSFLLKIYQEKYQVKLEDAHTGLVYDVLAAAAAAHVLEIPHEAILKTIVDRPVLAGRFEWFELPHGSGILINDSYNASPESMKLGLQALDDLKKPETKVAVIGDMLGLGADAPFWHRQIGRFLSKLPGINRVILVGNLVKWVAKTAPIHCTVSHVATWQEAVPLLQDSFSNGPVAILVKGSQDVGLSDLADACMQGVVTVPVKAGECKGACNAGK